MDQINHTKQTITQGSLSVIGCFDVEGKEHSSLRGISLENEPGENCDFRERERESLRGRDMPTRRGTQPSQAIEDREREKRLFYNV